MIGVNRVMAEKHQQSLEGGGECDIFYLQQYCTQRGFVWRKVSQYFLARFAIKVQ